MILAVTGGRAFTDVAMVDRNLSKWIRPGDDSSVIIHGSAAGADALADAWGHRNGVHVARVPALWDWWDKAAGPARNRVMMLLKPELLLAFPGERGTRDAIAAARELGISVRFAT